AAGINLPAKRGGFPQVRKVIRGQARLLLPAEDHQMAGGAGGPPIDNEGIARTLAPEPVVHENRKETNGKKLSDNDVDRSRKGAYGRARNEAQQRADVLWDADAHGKIVAGRPAGLRSQTRITAEQILAIGLPDLAVESIEERPGDELPWLHLNIATVI